VTREDILKAICETPGWHPTPQAHGGVERDLAELTGFGWIFSRMDGYEATPTALALYPAFGGGMLFDNAPKIEAIPTPEPEKADDGGPAWETEVQEDLIVLSGSQRIEARLGTPAVNGSIVLERRDSFARRVEVQVILRTRVLPDLTTSTPTKEQPTT
jgi:hypothetical protein